MKSLVRTNIRHKILEHWVVNLVCVEKTAKPGFNHKIAVLKSNHLPVVAQWVTGWDLSPPPNTKRQQKLAKKNGMKLIGYTFRLKKYVKIPPPILFYFSELVLSLSPPHFKGKQC